MGKQFTCKDPNGEPTRKQTWAVFCMTGQDIRESNLTRQEVSNMISDLKDSGDHTLPKGKTYGDGEDFICTKENLQKTSDRLWDKKTKPFTVKAVLESKQKRYSNGGWALDLIKQAEAAGEKAMQELIDSNKVAPMVVQQHADPMDDNSRVTEQWVVPGGPCGFASIRVKCTNGPSRKFINQLKKAGLAGGENSFKEWSKSSYYGGFMKSFTMIGGQSLAYKTAYANAYAEVLEKAGVNVWVWTRMD
jgi:hypothetical protein